MLKKTISFVFIILSILFVISCSDDDNPTGPEVKEAKELGIQEITVPSAMQQSNDPHAQMCSAYISMANGFKGFSSFFQPHQGSSLLKIFKTNDDWAHTWTEGQLTVTMNYFENDSVFGWELYFNGTDGSETYANWLAMKAEQKMDESYGTLIVFKPVTDQVQFEWIWTQTQTGQYTFTLLFYDDNGNPEGKIEVISNPDDSGELTFYKYINGAFVKETKTTWTSAGTGHWEEYDAEGNIVAEGDF